MHWHIRTFDELTKEELYEILRLRAEVFVVEQDCVYQDVDNKDGKALHLFGVEDQTIAAYTRIFKAGDYFNEASLGRVVVKDTFRGKDIGHALIKRTLDFMDEHNFGVIHISAQEHLKKFYEKHDFKQVTDTYLEDGIPHIGMRRILN